MEFPEKSGVFLLKVPNYIFNYVQQRGNNEEVGSMNLNEGTFKMRLPGQNPNEGYTLNVKMKKNQRGMFLVYEDKEKEAYSVKERVSYTAVLPRFLQREEDESNKKRVEIIENMDTKTIDFQKIEIVCHEDHNEIVNMRKSNDRRDKMDEDEIATRLFELYQDRPSYTFQELNSQLSQPKKFLDMMLEKYCEIENRQGQGRQKNYVLKSEYRTGYNEISKKRKK